MFLGVALLGSALAWWGAGLGEGTRPNTQGNYAGAREALPADSTDSVAIGTADNTPLPDSVEANRVTDLPQVSLGPLDRLEVQAGSAAIRGLVQTEDGTPVAGAIASWTAWDPRFLPYVTASKEIPADSIFARTIYAETNERGEFIFDETPPLLEGEPSFLWCTHPEFVAAVELVSPLGEEGSLKVEFELSSARLQSALVSVGGIPVDGAEIVQQVAYPRGSIAPYEGGKYAPNALLSFVRILTTDGMGMADLSPMNEQVYLKARYGDKLSIPWIGIPDGLVRLSLESTFEFSGAVDLPPDLGDSAGTPTVIVERVRGVAREIVGTVPVESDGEFGPVDLPALGAEYYSVALDGAKLQKGEVQIATPSTGDEVFVVLEGTLGNAVWYYATSGDDVPIPFPFLDLRWELDGRWHEQHVLGREDGYVVFTSCPEATLYGTIGAEGYGLAALAPIDIPEATPGVTRQVLWPAHRVSGVCMRGDEPARDFEVRFWAANNPQFRGRLVVTASETGEFTIENLPSPRVSLMAISLDYMRSEELVLDLRESGLSNDLVTLHLEPGVHLTGQVVEAGTKEPIPEALVTVYTNQGYTELDPIGAPALTDSNGKFSINRLGTGLNLFSISAHGHSTRGIKVKGIAGQSSDLGVIELGVQQPLTVRLVLPDGIDPTELMLTATGIGAIGTEMFDPNGVVYIENANSGSYTFEVNHLEAGPMPTWTRWYWLKPGEPWELIFEYAGGRGLALTATGAAGADDEVYGRVQFLALDGTTTYQNLYFNAGGEGTILGGIGEGPILISLKADGGGEVLAGALSYIVTEEDSDVLALNVDLHRGRTAVRVIDTEFKPVSGVNVRVRLAESEANYIDYKITGPSGEVTFLGLPEGNYRLDMTSSAAAQVYDIEFEVTGHETEPFEVVFDTSWAVKIKVVDEGVPQQLVDCRLWALDGDICLTSSQTPDEEGIVNIKDLGKGTYDLRLDGLHHWPVSRIVEANTGDHTYTIEVRQLGGVFLEFVRSDGIYFSGENVELECLSMGEKAANWIASGKLASEKGWLATNQEGLLSLPKLPHGKYRWSAAGATGTFVLAPGELLEKRIVIP
ncbi:MAG: hypothetical protein ACI8X5_003173 [Planctomycetota bacterium]|jgi:hypothetical protein